MKRNADYFKVGHVYNRQYFGSNEAYKKQNGQTTFRLLEMDGDKIKGKDLFATHPSDVESEELLGSTWHWSLSGLLKSQDEYTYQEVTDPKDYFVHSQKMTVKEAVETGLVLKETIEHVFRNQSGDFIRKDPVTCHSRWDVGGENFFSLQLNAEQGVSPNPYLQTIVFVWKSEKEMKADVRSVFPAAWFM